MYFQNLRNPLNNRFQSQSNVSNNSSGGFTSNRAQEPPRVANFEDRLKSIITTVLNEDQIARTNSSTTSKDRDKKPQTSVMNQLPLISPQTFQQPDYTQVHYFGKD